MPGRGRPNVSVRLDPALLAKLNAAAYAAGMDRAALLRALIRWYLGVPGAALPARPLVSEDDGP